MVDGYVYMGVFTLGINTQAIYMFVRSTDQNFLFFLNHLNLSIIIP